MKFENTRVFNFEGAFRGMRNPMNSWEKSDSNFSNMCHAPEGVKPYDCSSCGLFIDVEQPCKPLIGERDMKLARNLIHGGSEHRKFLRQIFVSVDITAPLYWWKEFDTYKVGTTSNSCSTMHKLAERPFTLDDFSHGHLTDRDGFLCEELLPEQVIALCGRHTQNVLEMVIDVLNYCREMFVGTKAKEWWWQMIQLLPSSYNQKRTISMTYENLFSICHQRKNHKLDEWSADDGSFLAWARTLPYAKELIFDE